MPLSLKSEPGSPTTPRPKSVNQLPEPTQLEKPSLKLSEDSWRSKPLSALSLLRPPEMELLPWKRNSSPELRKDSMPSTTLSTLLARTLNLGTLTNRSGSTDSLMSTTLLTSESSSTPRGNRQSLPSLTEPMPPPKLSPTDARNSLPDLVNSLDSSITAPTTNSRLLLIQALLRLPLLLEMSRPPHLVSLPPLTSRTTDSTPSSMTSSDNGSGGSSSTTDTTDIPTNTETLLTVTETSKMELMDKMVLTAKATLVPPQATMLHMTQPMTTTMHHLTHMTSTDTMRSRLSSRETSSVTSQPPSTVSSRL